MPSTARCRRETADALNAARAPRAGASSRSAPRRCACSRARRTRTARSRPFAGETAIFITPGYRFRAVDVLLTNFHLPRSTLFMLVGGLRGAGRDARGLRPRHRGGLPLLFLRRRLPAIPRAPDERPSPSPSRRGTARRAPACSRPRAATIRTPAFMPVGTAGTVKALTVDQVHATGADIMLGNTYHLMLRPAAERVGAAGRAAPVHALGAADPDRLRRLPGHVAGQDAQGRRGGRSSSRATSTASRHVLSPERVDRDPGDLLGSDIVMQLDECTALAGRRAAAARSDGAARCAGPSARKAAFGDRDAGQALFGISAGRDRSRALRARVGRAR